MLLLYASGNRDEEVFSPTADVFDLSPPGGIDASSSSGSASTSAWVRASRWLEARVLFEELLARFPDFALAGEIVPLRSTLMNGLVRMPVTFGRR